MAASGGPGRGDQHQGSGVGLAEAITDGAQDQLWPRLFDSIWAQRRNLSGTYDVRQVITEVMWPTDPIYPHLISPDLPPQVLHDPDLMRIVRRSGGR